MEFFIAGTDTGAGKTFVTAALCTALVDEGLCIGIQKWITTGDAERSGDMEFIMSRLFAGHGKAAAEKVKISAPYCLSFPASPHLASEIDGVKIDIEKILYEYGIISSRTDVLLVEGTGGIMVPVTRDLLYIDLLEKLRPRIILVARSGLGTINHTLLSLEALRARGLEILCVILNPVNAAGERDDTSHVIVRDNKKIISTLGQVDVFGPLPFADDVTGREIQAHIRQVTEKIRGCLS